MAHKQRSVSESKPKDSKSVTPVSDLIVIMAGMDVPRSRFNLGDSDIRWLRRNLGIRNSKHPQFNQAMSLLEQL